MNKLYFLLLFCLLFNLVSVATAQNDMQQIAQWARSAEASSEYTNDGWSAEQATGEPNVFECGDFTNAWASLTVSDEEYLFLSYREAVIPTQINVYESYNPGAIIGIAIVPANGDDPILIGNSEDPSDECPAVFSLNLPDGLPETDGVIIFLDQGRINDWNEIDAVELVGLVEGDPDDSEQSSLEAQDFPHYEVFSQRGQLDDEGNNDDDDDTTNTDFSFDGDWGTTVNCRDGGGIVDGTALTIIQQRSGNIYTVTAIGIDGFDPVLAVALSTNLNDALCSDDAQNAAYYIADLPTTVEVGGEQSTSQVVFNLNSNQSLENVAMIVGSADGNAGEFLLIIEGMFAGEADGAGDPFSLLLSPALFATGVPPTAYMISVTEGLDSMVFLIDGEYNYIYDADGNWIGCDDSGNPNTCWGDTEDLTGSFVSRTDNRRVGGWEYDAMLGVPIDESSLGFYYNFVMRGNNSYGDYVAVFHLGWAEE